MSDLSTFYLSIAAAARNANVTQDFKIKLPDILLFLHCLRIDLRDSFNLHTKNGRAELMLWWLSHGVKNHNFLRLAKEQIDILNQPDPDVVQDTPLPISKGLMLLHQLRPDLQAAYSLKTQGDRARFLLWSIEFGSKEFSFLQPTKEQIDILNQPDPGVAQDGLTSITGALGLLYLGDPHLQKLFCIKSPAGRRKLLDWSSKKQARYSWLFLIQSPCSKQFELLSNQTEELGQAPAVKNDSLMREAGLNLVGLASGTLGVGEDVRMAAAAMQKAKLRFSVCDTSWTAECDISSNTLAPFVTNEPKFRTNLICLPARNAILTYLEDSTCFSGQYNIGACQWELPVWPTILTPYFDLVDEVWAFSRYAEKVYQRATHKPVIYMPMCVEYPRNPLLFSREKFRILSDAFVFLNIFDGNSSLARKNPLGAVHAFKKAFPKNSSVRLILKKMNVNGASKAWQAVQDALKDDPRIIVIDAIYTRNEVMTLLQICDAYVSLHRAEGFGRILAESLLFEKPVIATNFSGNVDFTNEETAFMVNGKNIPIKAGDYSDTEDQFWCDPDVDKAAEQMLLCYENPALRVKRAKLGKFLIKQNYSANTVGTLYRKRLQEVGILQ